MIDIEKVIKRLEHISEWLFQQYRVVYDGDAPNYYDAYKAVDDAIALLKEQEAVEPTPLANRRYACGNCGNSLWVSGQRFCASCGRAVKWNE